MTTNRAKPAQKFRPVLTAAQIEHILALAKTEAGGISNLSMSLISTLSPFQAKIANAGIQPAYITQPVKPRKDSLEALGGGDGDGVLPNNTPKEIYWEMCYETYKASPALCSLDQISAAKEHMYLNDLMSPEELKQFEASTEETKANG